MALNRRHESHELATTDRLFQQISESDTNDKTDWQRISELWMFWTLHMHNLVVSTQKWSIMTNNGQIPRYNSFKTKFDRRHEYLATCRHSCLRNSDGGHGYPPNRASLVACLFVCNLAQFFSFLWFCPVFCFICEVFGTMYYLTCKAVCMWWNHLYIILWPSPFKGFYWWQVTVIN